MGVKRALRDALDVRWVARDTRRVCTNDTPAALVKQTAAAHADRVQTAAAQSASKRG